MTKTNFKRKAHSLILTLGVLSSFSTAYAQSEEQVLNSDPIDVDGYVKEAPATDHELESVKNELQKQKGAIQVNKEKSKKYQELGETTEKLADVTEEYIEDKKEAQQTINEYNKKIECLMQESKSKDCAKYVKNRHQDEVTTSAAAPAAPVVVAEAAKTESSFDTIRVTPYAGITNFSGQQENLQSNMAAGVRVESNIGDKFAFGIGLNYTQLTTRDFSNQVNGYNWSSIYYDFYGNQGREIEYKSYGINMYGKYYFSKGERFRPYAGAGIGVNRSTLEYTQNNSFNPNQFGNGFGNYSFGNERLTTNSVNGQIVAGSEVYFTKSVGLDVLIQYSRGLGSSFNNQNATNAANALDQKRLQDLSTDMNEANALSVFAGIVIGF